MSELRVRVLPLQPHCFAFGGFEIQMLSALDATLNQGVDIRKMDVWEQSADFEVLHLWGLDISQTQSINWAKSANKKVVVTALFPYLTLQHFVYYRTPVLFADARLKKLLVRKIDKLVVVNDLQAIAAKMLLGFPDSKIAIIPNIVSNEYFATTHENCSFNAGENYILTTGNVCERKNQLRLSLAALEENIPLKIIGDVLIGAESYAAKLRELVDNHSDTLTWIKGVEPNSDVIVNAVRDCAGFALPSSMEQQPISALEAASMRKPLLLGRKAYARQRYYENACLVNVESVSSISKGLRKIIENPNDHIPSFQWLSDCTEENVGKKYAELYTNV